MDLAGGERTLIYVIFRIVLDRFEVGVLQGKKTYGSVIMIASVVELGKVGEHVLDAELREEEASVQCGSICFCSLMVEGGEILNFSIILFSFFASFRER